MQSNNAAQAPRVFVSALPAALAQNLPLLHTIFTTFGEVEDVWARVVNRTRSVHESWGFVRFKLPEGAARAVSFEDWEGLLKDSGLSETSLNVATCAAESEEEVVSEATVIKALEREDAATFDFESFRGRFSKDLARPVLRRDAEVIFRVLQQHRPEGLTLRSRRSCKLQRMLQNFQEAKAFCSSLLTRETMLLAKCVKQPTERMLRGMAMTLSATSSRLMKCWMQLLHETLTLGTRC